MCATLANLSGCVVAVITIELNGEPFELDAEQPVSRLIERLGLRPVRIAVEVNREVVTKAEYPRTLLRHGDKVEIINFVGGG